jgi:hypothetical protein
MVRQTCLCQGLIHLHSPSAPIRHGDIIMQVMGTKIAALVPNKRYHVCHAGKCKLGKTFTRAYSTAEYRLYVAWTCCCFECEHREGVVSTKTQI